MVSEMASTVNQAAKATSVVKDKDLERLIAAILAADRWYVERSLELPGLCEADVIGTRFNPMQRRMIEAKSGKKLGASDAFKFESQRRFLDISAAAMVVPLGAPKEMDEVASWGGFAILRTNLSRPQVEAAVMGWLGSSPATATVDAWLRGYTVADTLVALIRSPERRKTSPTVASAWKAFHSVNAPTWMRMSPLERSMAAYTAFMSAPRAGRARAEEIAVSTGKTADQVFGESIACGKHPDIHALLLVEWLNRLEVIRLAVEASFLPRLRRPNHLVFAPAPPLAFQKCVDELRERSSIAAHLSMLLQSFIFRWGGFTLPGEEDDIGSDFGLTGVEVREALGLLDILFPRGRGESWMTSTIGAQWLTLVPYPLQGVGAMYRDEIKRGWDSGLDRRLAQALAERRKAAVEYLSQAGRA